MTKPLVVIGRTGQVARALAMVAAAANRPIIEIGRSEVDLAEPSTIERLPSIACSAIVNAAAYTAVDAAEADADLAFRVNRDAPAHFAAWALRCGAPLIQLSTDYVFDGWKGAPYAESDATNPLGVYGRSKLAGEQAVLASGASALVVRTSWVYAPGGRNFVTTMLAAARKHDRLRVVADQHGCPTSAADLARAVLALVDRLADGSIDALPRGVFHAAGSGGTTWCGLAEAVFAAADFVKARPIVEPITTAEWPTQARRPLDSRLDCAKLARVFGIQLPNWRDSLAIAVSAMRG